MDSSNVKKHYCHHPPAGPAGPGGPSGPAGPTDPTPSAPGGPGCPYSLLGHQILLHPILPGNPLAPPHL